MPRMQVTGGKKRPATTVNRRAKDTFPPSLQDAFNDPENCSLDPVAKMALSDDRHEYSWALHLLRNMYEFDREEAGVFLVGHFAHCGNDWEKRMAIVNVLYHVQTAPCVRLLFGELRRVKNTNSTRRYLRELISVLRDMPPKLVRPGFEALAEDKSFTNRARMKFQHVLDYLDYQDWRDETLPRYRRSS